MLRISFDIGGVISRYPEQFRQMIDRLDGDGYSNAVQVYIISDMHPHEKVMSVLELNKIYLAPERVLVADYVEHGDLCKEVLIKQHNIDIHIDDHPGYCVGSCIRLFLFPDPERPYYDDSWQTDGSEGNFGRQPLATQRARGYLATCSVCEWERPKKELDYKGNREGTYVCKPGFGCQVIKDES